MDRTLLDNIIVRPNNFTICSHISSIYQVKINDLSFVNTFNISMSGMVRCKKIHNLVEEINTDDSHQFTIGYLKLFLLRIDIDTKPTWFYPINLKLLNNNNEECIITYEKIDSIDLNSMMLIQL